MPPDNQQDARGRNFAALGLDHLVRIVKRLAVLLPASSTLMAR